MPSSGEEVHHFLDERCQGDVRRGSYYHHGHLATPSVHLPVSRPLFGGDSISSMFLLPMM